MRILMYNASLPYIGTYFRCLMLGQSLVKLGHTIYLVCQNPSGKRELKVFNNEGVIEIYPPHKMPGSIERILLTRKIKFDVIHSFGNSHVRCAIPAITFKLLKKFKIIIDVDDWLTGGGFVKRKDSKLYDVMKFFEIITPYFGDAVTVVSDLLYQRVKNRGVNKKRIHIIGNGSNTNVFGKISRNQARSQLKLEAKHPSIIYMGLNNLLQRFMVKVMKNIVKQVPQSILYIIGPPQRGIFRFIKKFSLEKNVLCLGRLEFNKIPMWLASGDVLALPMQDIISERARWPIRFGDYMAAGRVIIANDVGEVGSIIKREKCGYISPSNDLESFSDNIIKILQDEKLKKNIEDRTKFIAANKFSWEVIAKKLSRIYESLM